MFSRLYVLDITGRSTQHAAAFSSFVAHLLLMKPRAVVEYRGQVRMIQAQHPLSDFDRAGVEAIGVVELVLCSAGEQDIIVSGGARLSTSNVHHLSVFCSLGSRRRSYQHLSHLFPLKSSAVAQHRGDVRMVGAESLFAHLYCANVQAVGVVIFSLRKIVCVEGLGVKGSGAVSLLRLDAPCLARCALQLLQKSNSFSHLVF